MPDTSDKCYGDVMILVLKFYYVSVLFMTKIEVLNISIIKKEKRYKFLKDNFNKLLEYYSYNILYEIFYIFQK